MTPLPHTRAARFALDLVEVYFQIVHTRLPFLNPAHFRARLNVFVPHAEPGQYTGGSATSTSTSASASSLNGTAGGGNGGGGVAVDPLHPALMATVIAWGAKFSEHPLLVADRAQTSMRQSALAKALIDRAREVAEALKVHRVPAAEHVVIALLLEPLQSRACFLSSISRSPVVPSRTFFSLHFFVFCFLSLFACCELRRLTLTGLKNCRMMRAVMRHPVFCVGRVLLTREMLQGTAGFG